MSLCLYHTFNRNKDSSNINPNTAHLCLCDRWDKFCSYTAYKPDWYLTRPLWCTNLSKRPQNTEYFHCLSSLQLNFQSILTLAYCENVIPDVNNMTFCIFWLYFNTVLPMQQSNNNWSLKFNNFYLKIFEAERLENIWLRSVIWGISRERDWKSDRQT